MPPDTLVQGLAISPEENQQLEIQPHDFPDGGLKAWGTVFGVCKSSPMRTLA
jgi:hypothetical protein